jgi:hypothetical protein
MPADPINCGRCAHLWNRTNPGFGICACKARQDKTGKIRPVVSLDSTCDDAQLSAKFDPDFFPRLAATRRGSWETPPPAEPTPQTPDPDAH